VTATDDRVRLHLDDGFVADGRPATVADTARALGEEEAEALFSELGLTGASGVCGPSEGAGRRLE
jgi:hypothetical protein